MAIGLNRNSLSSMKITASGSTCCRFFGALALKKRRGSASVFQAALRCTATRSEQPNPLIGVRSYSLYLWYGYGPVWVPRTPVVFLEAGLCDSRGRPEAAIYENHFVSGRKNDIRRSRQAPSVESKTVAERVQQSSDHEFRRGVFPANARH